VKRISYSTSARESGTPRCLDPFKPGKKNTLRNNQNLKITSKILNLKEKNLSKSLREPLLVLPISTRDGGSPLILSSFSGESNI
jgi:hypothetical protein